MDNYKKDLIKKIKKVRVDKSITQAELATKAKISINYYARLERGEENPSMDVLLRITKILNLKSSEVLPF